MEIEYFYVSEQLVKFVVGILALCYIVKLVLKNERVKGKK